MIIEETERLICKTEMDIDNGALVFHSTNNSSNIDILKIKASTGMEYGFLFYDKFSQEEVCQIHFENKRREFEISYGTEERYQRKGFMKEALSFFTKWIFNNTCITTLCALINNNDVSRHILENEGFKYINSDQFGDWFELSCKHERGD